MKIPEIRRTSIVLGISLAFLLYPSQSKANIEDSPLDWGSTQVNLLLHDRPQLQSIVTKGNKIWDWLTSAFGSTNEGIKIHWDASPLSDFGPYDAESHWLYDSNNVYVRAGRFHRNGSTIGSERLPEEILFSIVFELNNVKYRDENLKLRSLASEGRISREDYVRGIAKCEYLASQETGIFYRNIWTPFCVETDFNLNPHIWITARDVSFDQWLSQYPSNFFYPWKFYGKQYDIIREQRINPKELNGSSRNQTISG